MKPKVEALGYLSVGKRTAASVEAAVLVRMGGSSVHVGAGWFGGGWVEFGDLDFFGEA
jgi:hypothetical protein